MLREQEVVGSSPVTPTNSKITFVLCTEVIFLQYSFPYVVIFLALLGYNTLLTTLASKLLDRVL